VSRLPEELNRLIASPHRRTDAMGIAEWQAGNCQSKSCRRELTDHHLARITALAPHRPRLSGGSPPSCGPALMPDRIDCRPGRLVSPCLPWPGGAPWRSKGQPLHQGDFRTTCSSRMLENLFPPYESTVTETPSGKAGAVGCWVKPTSNLSSPWAARRRTSALAQPQIWDPSGCQAAVQAAVRPGGGRRIEAMAALRLRYRRARSASPPPSCRVVRGSSPPYGRVEACCGFAWPSPVRSIRWAPQPSVADAAALLQGDRRRRSP